MAPQWWDPTNPGAGDTQQVSDFSTVMDKRRTGLDSVRVAVQQAVHATFGGFESQAGVSWRLVTESFSEESFNPAMEYLRRAEGAAQTYIQDLHEIKKQTGYAEGNRVEAERAMQVFRDANPNGPGSPEAQLEEQRLNDQMQAAGYLIGQLMQRRQEADGRFMRVLDAVPDFGGIPAERLVSTGAAMGPDWDMSEAIKGIRVLEALIATEAYNHPDNHKYFYDTTEDRNLEQPQYDTSRAEATQLCNEMEATLRALGNDPDMWNAYFDGLGGKDLMPFTQSFITVDNIDEIKAMDDPGFEVYRRAGIAATVREGLSIASADWPPDKCEGFAREMLEGAFAEDTRTDIAFFFAEPETARMGENFTVTFADIMDNQERGINGVEQQEYWGSAGAHTISGELASYAAEDTHFTGGQYNDPSAMIFRTLQEYPDSALEWMLDGPDGTGDNDTSARIEYWFGDRNSASSGFLGPIALLEGSQHATGGLLDPGLEGVDMDVLTRQMQAFDGAIEELVDGTVDTTEGQNAGFDPDNLVDARAGDGSTTVSFARVLGNYTPVLTEVLHNGAPFDGDMGGDGVGVGPSTGDVLKAFAMGTSTPVWLVNQTMEATFGSPDDIIADNTNPEDFSVIPRHIGGGLGEEWPIPGLQPDELADAFRMIAGDPEALRVYGASSSSYVETLRDGMDLYAASDGQYGFALDEGMPRIARLEGMLSAIAIGREEEIAVDDAAYIDGAIDWTTWAGGRLTRGGVDLSVAAAPFEWMADDIRSTAGVVFDVNWRMDGQIFESVIDAEMRSSKWENLHGVPLIDPESGDKSTDYDAKLAEFNTIYENQRAATYFTVYGEKLSD